MVRKAVMTTKERELLREAERNVRILSGRARDVVDLTPIGFRGGMFEGVLAIFGWLISGGKA